VAGGHPATFNPSYVIADPIFQDWTTMSESDVLAFLETHGPQRGPSFLATYQDAGRPAAVLVANAATACRINPRVLLAQLEMQTGLITGYSDADSPSQDLIDFALGFGCDDNERECSRSVAGLDSQLLGLACYYRELLDGEYESVSSWRKPGDNQMVRDGTIHPASLSTLALYLHLGRIESQGGDRPGVRDFWDAWVSKLDLGDIQGYSIMDTVDDLGYPFQSGDWYVFQGYDTGTHVGVFRFAFDLVKDDCCNDDTSAPVVAAASGTFYKYNIGSGLGWGVQIVLADGSVVENDHLWPVSSQGNYTPINKGDYIGDIYQGKPGGLNHLHFQVNQGGQPVPLDFGVWDYPDNGPSNNCGCGAHGEWSGTKVGCCGCLPAACCSSLQSQAGSSTGAANQTDRFGAEFVYPTLLAWAQAAAETLSAAEPAARPLADTRLPSAPAGLQSGSHGAVVWSSDPVVHLRWDAPDEGPLAGYTLAWDQSPDTEPAASLDLAGSATEATSPPLETGAWYAHLRAVDGEGRAGATAHAGPFLVDVTAPGTAGAAGAAHLEGALHLDVHLGTYTWAAAEDTGSGVAGYRVYWGEDPLGECDTWVSDAAYSPPALEAGVQVAERTLRVAAVDGAGNQGAWTTVAEWRYDGAPPQGALQINNGGGTSRSLNVTLHLAAEDEGSGVVAARFSRDGALWGEWEPYAPQRGWRLADQEEEQVVYAQIRDGAGNESAVYQAAVRVNLDVAAPSSASYQLARSVLGLGGGSKASSSYRVVGTSGQTTGVGWLGSASYEVLSGFWTSALPWAADYRVYLPLVVR
jgi:hypothetical protein